MPTTVSSGVVLTQQANGNYALALLLTVITNTSAVFTIPPMLKWLAKFTSDVELDIAALIAKLVSVLHMRTHAHTPCATPAATL